MQPRPLTRDKILTTRPAPEVPLEGQVIAERYTCLALQSKSSLGPLYAAKANDGTDPLFASLFRNLRAIDRLNARDPKGAITVLDTPLPPVREAASALAALARGEIDRQTSQRLALDDAAMSRFGGSAGQLSEVERASLLDAQAHYLRGVARRIQGDDAGTRLDMDVAVLEHRGVEHQPRGMRITAVVGVEDLGVLVLLDPLGVGADIGDHLHHRAGVGVDEDRLRGLVRHVNAALPLGVSFAATLPSRAAIGPDI